MLPLIDSHLDLAWNALGWNRDLNAELASIRSAEAELDDNQGRGTCTVCFPEMRRAGIRLCFATVLARAKPDDPANRRMDLDSRTREICSAMAWGHCQYYNLLQRRGQLEMIGRSDELTRFWENGDAPLGIVLSMEGADPILDIGSFHDWWDAGLRILGLVHYGWSHYAGGTGVEDGLTRHAPPLLKEMERVGAILDVSHLSEQSFFQALDVFHGPAMATHSNCRVLAPGNRQLSDEQIARLIERGAVIGAVLDNWQLVPDWRLGKSNRAQVPLELVTEHIDHVCQIAGNARHAAIGSDLDGGYGTEQCPAGLESIADLQLIRAALERKGYALPDIERIFWRNWFEFLQKHLPDG